MWKLVGGENHQDPYKVNYDIGLERWLRQDSEGILLALPAERKLLLMVFIDIYGGESIYQINNYVPGTRRCANFLKKWNHSCYSSCNEINTWLSLWQSIIILQDLSDFCRGQTGELDGDAVGITISASFKFMMVIIQQRYFASLQRCGISFSLLFS